MNIRPLLFALSFVFAASIARAGCAYDVKTKVFTPDGCQHSESRMGQDLIDAAEAAANKTINATAADPTKTTTTPPPPPPPAPTKLVTKQEFVNQLREQEAAALADPDNTKYKTVITDTTRRMIHQLKDNEMYDPAQAKALGPLFDVQIQEQDSIWKLNNQRAAGQLRPGEYETQLQDIVNRSNDAMKPIPPGVVMDVFHPIFNTTWGEFQKALGDSNAPVSGLPTSKHIGGMLDADPKNAANWALSGAEKLQNGDIAGGLKALNQSIALGGTADAFGMRGGILLDKKDYEGAYKDALSALKLSPGDQPLTGLLKSAEGRIPPERAAALAAGSSAAGGGAGGAGGGSERSNASSGFATGGFGSSGARSVAGMTSAAVIASSQKLDEARRLMSIGDFAGAVAAAQRALELNPSNAAAHGFLSMIYARKGDYARAIASANAGLALAPHDAALLGSKAYAENRAKRYRDALATSNAFIEADPRNPLGYAYRAHAYGGLGDKDAMMSDIGRAASMDPRFQKAAADAAALQLPSSADILFMFPGEDPVDSPAAAAAPRRSFGLVLGAGLLGGLLLALGLLSTVLAPLKESVVSAFTKATRRGPSLHELEQPAEEAASGGLAAGAAAGLIRGQYEISRQIGAGGMGTVYEGTDRSLNRRVAIKKMRDELRVNARERDRFIIEAKTVASLHHPNIVDIYAIAEEGDDVYLIFEYVEGRTVHDIIQANGRLRVEDAARVTRAIADALAYAHAHGGIHRDMKPSNVMLNGTGVIKVMDFGIARLAKDAMTRYSMTNTVVGTPPYMAPEQEQGVVRKESDVYSLAICAYEMLTGKLPFIGVAAGMLMNKINMSYIPPSRATAGLPGALDEVFAKAFQADPEKRYRTPQEFAAALERSLGGSVRSS
ncbi:MAG: protein kinase [Elusimicrobia bacterium]|nr:protein kinase [Elusimicrobiota bacterium]